MLVHLAVSKCHLRVRRQRCHMVCDLVNIVDPIVYIIHLSPACKLPVDRLPHHLVIIFHHIRLDWNTVYRRLLQHAHIADTDETHVQRPRNRRRRQRQHIHILLHLLDFFLVSHAKTLLFVDNQQTEVLKLHIFGKHTVRPDHNIHIAFFQPFDRLFDLARCAEPGHHIHAHRKILHSLDKGIVMLLSQNRRRDEIHDLFFLLHGLKCCP